MIINVPIESLSIRYSQQWNDWFPEAFDIHNVKYRTIYPQPHTTEIKQGEFLDVIGTNVFKMRQLESILLLIDQGEITDNDVFFFHDIWFPGLEALFYVRSGLNLNFKVAGILHAGTYDDWDFVTRAGMRKWGADIEKSWFNEVDALFVATDYHKNIVKEKRGVPTDKIHVTSFPLKVPTGYDTVPRQNQMVFGHRLTPDKAPDEFDLLVSRAKERLAPSWYGVKTQSVPRTKDEYYRVLAASKIAVSCARHEFWGIAQQEAMLLGAIPLVPDRLSYVELYDPLFRYASLHEATEKIVTFAENYETIITDDRYLQNRDFLINRNRMAVPTMLSVMENLGCKLS